MSGGRGKWRDYDVPPKCFVLGQFIFLLWNENRVYIQTFSLDFDLELRKKPVMEGLRKGKQLMAREAAAHSIDHSISVVIFFRLLLM